MSTIAAISTSPGIGGIGIIRMSGEHTFDILSKIFVPKSKSKIRGFTLKYGNIVDSEHKVVDEVLVSYFVAPKSYTTENMCEINSHGRYSDYEQNIGNLLEKWRRTRRAGGIYKKGLPKWKNRFVASRGGCRYYKFKNR